MPPINGDNNFNSYLSKFNANENKTNPNIHAKYSFITGPNDDGTIFKPPSKSDPGSAHHMYSYVTGRDGGDSIFGGISKDNPGSAHHMYSYIISGDDAISIKDKLKDLNIDKIKNDSPYTKFLEMIKKFFAENKTEKPQEEE